MKPTRYTLALAALFFTLALGFTSNSYAASGKEKSGKTKNRTEKKEKAKTKAQTADTEPGEQAEEKEAPPAFSEVLLPAFKYHQNKQYKRSLKTLKDIEAQDKFREQADLELIRGMNLLALSDEKQAFESLSSSLRLRRSNSDALYYIAKTLLQSGKKEKALATFAEAIWFNRFKVVSPGMVNFELARMYQEQGQADKAEEYYKKASQSGDVLRAQDTLFLSSQILKRGNKEQAVAMLREQLEKDPDNQDLQHGLAATLLVNADWLVDRADIKESTQILDALMPSENPTEQIQSPYFPTYVRALLATKRVTEAKKIMDQAMQNNPSSPTLQNLMQQVEIEAKGEDYKLANRKSLAEESNS